MNPIKALRKLGKLIRGGAGTWQIVSGCLLGVLIGMIPGFNMTVVIAILLLLLLNANFGLAILGFLVGKALCLLLAPLTFQIGYVLIHGIGLEGAFRAMSEMPVVALMDLHYYCLIGGLPVALVVGCAMGWGIGRTIHMLRAGLKMGAERSERFKRLTGALPVRILLRVVFGKQKKPLAEMLETRHPLLRKSGVILCAVVVGLLLVFEFLFLDQVARAGIKSGLEAAVGAQVDVEGVDMSLFGGRMKIAGLQVTDPDRPTHNMVQIDQLTADVGISDLLARRFVIDLLVIGRTRTDVQRSSPGTVFKRPEPPKPKMPEITLGDYFEHAEKVVEYLRKLKDYLDERTESQERKEEPVSKEDVKELAREQGYLSLSAAGVLAKRPRVTIRQIRIEDLRIGERDGYLLEGKEISDRPELNEKPMLLAVSDKAGMEGLLKLDFTRPGASHAVQLVVPDVPIGEAIRLSDRVPVNVKKAKVTIKAQGEFNSRTINLPVALEVSDMEAGARPGRGALGLDPATTAKIFEKISTLTIVAALEGPIATPRVRIDDKKLLESLKETLIAVGSKELAGAVNGRLGALVDKAPIKIPSGLGPGGSGDLFKGIGDVFGPKKDEDKKTGEDPKKPPTSKPADIFNGLFR